jgi:hypothetical protein
MTEPKERKNEALWARIGSTETLDRVRELYLARTGLRAITRSAMLEIILVERLKQEEKKHGQLNPER